MAEFGKHKMLKAVILLPLFCILRGSPRKRCSQKKKNLKIGQSQIWLKANKESPEVLFLLNRKRQSLSHYKSQKKNLGNSLSHKDLIKIKSMAINGFRWCTVNTSKWKIAQGKNTEKWLFLERLIDWRSTYSWFRRKVA